MSEFKFIFNAEKIAKFSEFKMILDLDKLCKELSDLQLKLLYNKISDELYNRKIITKYRLLS